jgi:hypothetical protein
LGPLRPRLGCFVPPFLPRKILPKIGRISRRVLFLPPITRGIQSRERRSLPAESTKKTAMGR